VRRFLSGRDDVVLCRLRFELWREDLQAGPFEEWSDNTMEAGRFVGGFGWTGCGVGILLAGMLLPGGVRAQDPVSVLTQHNDRERTGANLRETVLTPANVNAKQFGMLFKRVVDDQVYGQPLVVANVKIGGGTHDVVYVTTVNNSVYAFDANEGSASAPIWHVNFGVPANLHDGKFGCLDINGKMGIIGTPVIDAASGTLYVVAMTRVSDAFMQRLHALDLATGADVANSPVVIAAPGFDALMQNQRPALLLSNGSVYVGYASHCDKDPYHGFLLGYDAKSLRQTAVFNTSPTGMEASIWQSGQAPAVDAQGNIYVVTGNGSWDGKVNFSESFLKLDPNLKLLDWFTPTNHFTLDKDDNDLNSSGATLIPGTHLVMGGGKEGVLYALDVNHLGHLGDEYAVQHFQATTSHLHSLVYWKSAKSGELLYVWGQRDRAKVYKFDGGKLGETPFMTRQEVNEGHPGAMLSLSANGDRNGILWAAIHATGDSWHESRPGILHAYDADDIGRELWSSLENPGRDDCGNYAKMAPPTIANGEVYLASFGTENVGTGQVCAYGLLPGGPPPAAPVEVTAIVKDGMAAISWAAVAGARTYTVGSSDKETGPFRMIAAGLTSTEFGGIPIDKGSTYFVVAAVNSNGVGGESTPVSVMTESAGAVHRMH
jgi:outer membrane protein assembly factor BamB